jgi:hypothetical protein
MLMLGVLFVLVVCDLYLANLNSEEELKIQKRHSLLFQIILVLPLHLRPNRTVIHEIARIPGPTPIKLKAAWVR